MFVSPEELLSILEQYKYYVIFPITVIEGPIMTVISGFLIHLGILNGVFTFFLVIVGDLIGDVIHYGIGRFGRSYDLLKKWGKYIGYDEERERLIEEHFIKHKGKTILLGKAAHGVGGFFQIAAGIAKMNFWDFLAYSFVGTVPKCFILLLLGFYLGSSYEKIDNYLDYIAIVTIGTALLVLAYKGSHRIVRNYLEQSK